MVYFRNAAVALLLFTVANTAVLAAHSPKKRSLKHHKVVIKQKKTIEESVRTIKIPSNIRVLLKEYPLNESCAFDVSAPDNVIVYDTANPTTRVAYPYHNMHLFLKEGELFCKDPAGVVKRIKKDEISISTDPHHLSVNNIPYQGVLTLKIDRAHDRLLLINTVNLDDYIYGVLRWESFQSWPHEMQKVQAIASRTFAVYHILNSRATHQPYDLKNSNFHQTYNGTHAYEHLREAVEETAGTILTYNNTVVLAMFDICCGGIIPGYMKSPNFSEAPYLARKKPCTYCNHYKLYSWKHEFSLSDLHKRCLAHKNIAQKVAALGTIKDLHICEKDKAGIVHTIKLVGSKKNATFTARQLKDCLQPQLKSLTFAVKKEQNTVMIKGSGFGHQLGLCQRGARELVKQGWPAHRILAFYYPHTTLYKQ